MRTVLPESWSWVLLRLGTWIGWGRLDTTRPVQVVYDGCGGLYTYYQTSTYSFMECYLWYF